MNKKCRICGAELIDFIQYENTPPRAQYLSQKQKLRRDKPIKLKLMQCLGCGVIQIPTSPVIYYKQAIRSEGWDNDPFRKQQLDEFKKEFDLEGKKIVKIDEKPKPDKYDGFLMFNYLEHFPHPKIILNQIYNNLSDGGVGIVEVPNFNEIVDERIFSEFIIDHLFYFNRNTLRFVLEMNGFEVLRIDEIFEGASLSATVKKRELISPEPFIENQEKLISDIDLFLVRNKKVAIWGASHQTLLMLPMIHNAYKIKYIIDDFEDKQNLYTAIVNKKILPSTILEENPVEGIIIIVGWQYKKVLKRLRKMKLSPIPKLALIRKATLEHIE